MNTRYRFEQAVQEVKEDTRDWLRDEFKAILESDKDFTRKTDYIGFSILSIDARVSSLDEEIKELQEIKKKLKTAKCLSLVTGALVLADYGIDKLEGAGISSISINKASTKVVQKIEILNEEELIKRGFSMTVLDEDAVLDTYNLVSKKHLVEECCKVESQVLIVPAKLKINKRRKSKAVLEVAS